MINVLTRFSPRACRLFSSAAVAKNSPKTNVLTSKASIDYIHYDEFSQAYPDFMMSPVVNRRDPLYEELVHADMLERRIVIDIPEFYVGSIMAVTTADPNLGNRRNRFVGICISRERCELHHRFTLRNVIDGLGVEVMYELYNPTILKIETLKLEKRLDDDLSYLKDALPEYSITDFNLEPVTHPPGTPVPVNCTKVKMRPPPWCKRWDLYDLKGVEGMWESTTPYFKRKMIRVTKFNMFQKFDIVMHYRDECRDHERDLKIQERMVGFETGRQRAGATRRRILRIASAPATNKRQQNKN